MLQKLMERAIEEHASDPERAARNFLGRLAHSPAFHFQEYFRYIDELVAAARTGRQEFEAAMRTIATSSKGVTTS